MYTEPIRPATHTPDQRPVLAPPALDDAKLRTDVAGRLIRVCGDMAPAAFDALVDEISVMKVRWARKRTSGRDD